ncbi:MAG: triple tyrosine motif-containing protein, partial [Acidobacteriota bacterium]
KNGVWRTIRAKDGLPSENIISLLTDSNGVLWIGTAKGLAFIDSSGRLRRVSENPALPDESILGIAEDNSGGLWISTPNHVLRAERNKLLTDQISESDVRQYNLSDGLKSSEGIKRSQTVVADAAGRVWFSLNRGISMVDTERLKNVQIPAIVQIQSISVDGGAVELTDDVRLPAMRQRLVFGYSGLSLTMPERVKFRYFLENFDKNWGEPTTAREAIYTNLSPGEYVFHVIASNSDEVWNSNEATIRITIEPAYWQTWWFRLMCAIAAALTLLGFYRLRLRRITGALNRRFEERLAERTLIAQELHDSLLQGVVSASMQLNVAVDNLPDDSAAKKQFNRVVQLMGQVTTEGRNTLRGLRAPAEENSENLEKSFADLEKDFARLGRSPFRVIIEGEPRILSSVVRDEVYFIGREALLNACRHSNADNIEIIIEYHTKNLRVVIRDDGRGINQEILQNGREGHWGLVGMRERAEKIGGRLKVWSRANAGTEIELIVPPRVAYEKSAAARPFKWFSKSPFRQPKTSPKEQKQ